MVQKAHMDALSTFKSNVAEVDRLINFDKEVLQVVTMTMEDLHGHLKQKFADERLNGARALQVVKGIRNNETLRTKYQAIFNQAIVLLVSHFASALGEAFRAAVSINLESTKAENLFEEEIKLTVREMRERDWNLKGSVADLLIAKYDFTFQDMASTVRAFKNFTNIVPERDEIMNNIIAAQACRHVIVHAGGRVGERTLKQVSGAKPRTLKSSLSHGEIVHFSAGEVDAVKNDMLVFVERLSSPRSRGEAAE